MPASKGPGWFLLYAACAAVFVVATGLGLPELVASHFGGDGLPNGHMPRAGYIGFMLVCLVGVPTAMVFLTRRAIARPTARIRLPHPQHWLAPQRRAATVAYLRQGVLWFGVVLVTFLCYVHALVVRANAAQPVQLSLPALYGGLVVFFAVLLVWLRAFVGRFRRTD